MKEKYKCPGVGWSCVSEINVILLTSQSVPMNTSAADAQSYRWKRITQQNNEFTL